jgi:hypothetical protein
MTEASGRGFRKFIVLAVAPACMIGVAQGQDTTPPERNPTAIQALEKMVLSLKGLQAFSVTADITRESVLTSGQKLQYPATVTIHARRPDAFRFDIYATRREQSLIYDGKTLTRFSPREGYFASVSAPAGIDAVIPWAEQEYRIDFPLVDLFTWGGVEDKAAISSAMVLGTERIDGQMCDHFAMRQERGDWQIWIRSEGDALPCRIVLTSTRDPSMPQTGLTFRWNTSPAFATDQFTFKPPPGARQIKAVQARTDTRAKANN